jgi:hypothetical protein
MEVRSAWLPTEVTCVLENTLQSRDNITATMTSDAAILVTMLLCLLRSRQTKYGILRHLHVQVSGAMFRFHGHCSEGA